MFIFDKAYILLFCQCIAFFVLLKKYFDSDIKPSRIIKWVLILCAIIFVSFIFAKLTIIGVQSYTKHLANGYTLTYIQYDFTNIKSFIISLKNFLIAYTDTIGNRMKTSFGEKMYIASIGIMLVCTIYASISKKDFFIIILGLGNIIITFGMHIVTGNAWLPQRAYCFNYALFVAESVLFGGYFIINYVRSLFLTNVFYFLILFIIGNQSKEMEELYYQKYITCCQDKRFAEQVIQEVERECGRISTYNKPIVFMGFPNDYTLQWDELESTSIFIHDRLASVTYEETSRRIYNLYKELGYSLKKASDIAIDYYDVRYEVASMSAFPEDGCVKEQDDYIIVKLGDSLCEILDDENSNWKMEEDLTGNIDWCIYEDRILNIGGWLNGQDYPSYNNISLILWNDKNQYRMRLDERVTKITSNIDDSINYKNYSFNNTIILSDYIESGHYTIYLELSVCNDEKYLYNTGQIINVN